MLLCPQENGGKYGGLRAQLNVRIPLFKLRFQLRDTQKHSPLQRSYPKTEIHRPSCCLNQFKHEISGPV